jgi:hypothetical protein
MNDQHTNTGHGERELAHRVSDGLEVTLLWHPSGDGDVAVEVLDVQAGESFRLRVPGDRALDAYYHPYAYADESVNRPLPTLNRARV